MVNAVQTPFRLKADMLAVTVMHLQSDNLEEIASHLKETIAKAPRFFDQAPLLIDTRDINAKTLNLPAFMTLLSDCGLTPAGIRGLDSDGEAQARSHGLACFQANSAAKPAAEKPNAPPPPVSSNTKLITTPIRAGTKVYAKGGDLVIIAPVNVGAECIADGNIHVYGPLRGRALAGASGDHRARIFCRSMEAELIAIAGHYQVRENLVLPEKQTGLLQVCLENNKLSIESI